MTRGLYGFRKNGIDKTTYSNSDSYPGYLGELVVNLCKSMNVEQLNNLYNKIMLRNKEESYQIPSSQRFDFGKVHSDLVDGKTINMIEDCSFIKDSLFCEYAYIINLDNNTLEYWKGFQKVPQENNRYGTIPMDNGYYPCKLMLSFDLNNLPNAEEIVKLMNDAK